MKGESSNRKVEQKEASNAIIEFYHHYETVQRMTEIGKTEAVRSAFAAFEKKMRLQGVVLVIHCLQILNKLEVIEVAELQKKPVKELKVISEKFPKDVTEYVNSLIGAINDPKKKEKEKVVKKKEGVESRKLKRSKGKEKGKKKEEEEIEEEPAEPTFIDYFKQVTDYGGPLFKNYDRKQLKQMLHANKVELQQKLGLVIMQSVSDGERMDMASLAMNLNYGVIPFIPSIKEAKCLLSEYNKDETYQQLVTKTFGEDEEVAKQSFMDLIPFFVQN